MRFLGLLEADLGSTSLTLDEDGSVSRHARARLYQIAAFLEESSAYRPSWTIRVDTEKRTVAVEWTPGHLGPRFGDMWQAMLDAARRAKVEVMA